MKRMFVLAIFVGSALLMSLQGWSDERTRDLIINQFDLALPKADRATVYVQEDSEFFLFPAFDNQDYVHICSGSWRTNNHSRTVTFRGKDKCHIMDGTYQVSHQPDGLYLHNSSRNFVLEHLD